MDLGFLAKLLPMLFTGLKVTILIAIVGILFGFLLGTLAGFALESKIKFFKGIANVYIWVIRGTPLIVQALYIYYVIPKLFGMDLSSNFSGILVISLNSGAFIAEIVRGALNGIDPGQREAGLSLGLTQSQTTWHIIVPPAFRSILPALFNQFIISVKDTALLSVIVVNEITHQAQNYASLSYKTIPTYTTLAVFYLVLISILIVAQKTVERKITR
ncbi:glutamine transport system permease protein [Pseudobutyrivibrio sp. OR37]|uniref:amino acid ABC transporter permease n=1 Tax=Pseudobutyrivibrio sp. OR37 TaxID=1798186 RepID=UPI0008E9F9E4|nr:amino acid ABC transporter permease [Pseudobutyrivibrio sp. OR37]SFH65393.1 glutamine transport system permease protein [Pseudobutyrivibrio sp. OR37]